MITNPHKNNRNSYIPLIKITWGVPGRSNLQLKLKVLMSELLLSQDTSQEEPNTCNMRTSCWQWQLMNDFCQFPYKGKWLTQNSAGIHFTHKLRTKKQKANKLTLKKPKGTSFFFKKKTSYTHPVSLKPNLTLHIALKREGLSIKLGLLDLEIQSHGTSKLTVLGQKL